MKDSPSRSAAGRGAPGRRMLITGGHGLLGREIAGRFRGECEIRVTDQQECDVTDADAVRRAIGEFLPDIVVHCAAYTAVDRAEEEDAAAMSVNAGGTGNVARECRERGALLVTFGTDYIFDGASRRPYREDDAPGPLSAYGKSKLAAEAFLANEAGEHLLIRSQWLYGPHGRNFVSTVLDKARRGEPLRVVDDQTGCPTYSRDLADATALLLSRGARGTFHFSNEGETTWFGFASFVLSRACPGYASLSPAHSRDLSYPARRPEYSALSKEKYRRAAGTSPRRWEEAAAEFLKDFPQGRGIGG